MKICPECGYEEHPMWRSRSNRAFCSYTKWETLKYNNEKLAMAVFDSHPMPYSDGHFMYKITRSGLNVERIEIQYFKIMKWGSETQERTKRTEKPETSVYERAPIPGADKPNLGEDPQTNWDEWIPALREHGMTIEKQSKRTVNSKSKRMNE